MASVFKVGDKYRVQFTHNKRVHTINVGSDEENARAHRERIEKLVELARTGERPSGGLKAWCDTLDDALAIRLVEAGLIEAGTLGRLAAPGKTVAEHLEDYLANCAHLKQSRRHLVMKRAYIGGIIKGITAKRLEDLTPDAVQGYLRDLAKPRGDKPGKAARTVNGCRAAAVAFLNWCVSVRRVTANPLKIIPKMNERKDRRRMRRAADPQELAWLLAHCGKRRMVYLAAAWLAWRRSELRRLTWGNLDLAAGIAKHYNPKADEWQETALHPEIVAEFAKIRPADAAPDARVFATMPTIKTFYDDLRRAREAYIEAAGTGKAGKEERERRIKSTFLAKRDEAGRWLDLHAMRKTLCTALARAGVVPQVAQQILGHKDLRTTMQHYTDLRLSDSANAIESLPHLLTPRKPDHEEARATGTHGQLVNQLVNRGEKGRILAGSGGRFGRAEMSKTAQNKRENVDFSQCPRRGSNLQPSASEAELSSAQPLDSADTCATPPDAQLVKKLALDPLDIARAINTMNEGDCEAAALIVKALPSLPPGILHAVAAMVTAAMSTAPGGQKGAKPKQ